MNWKWQKADWLLVIGIVAGGVTTLLLLLHPNPDPDNARYILSTIPETIGTVFVITIAIMQMLGHLKLKELVMRPEFVVTSIATFGSIVASLIILYFNAFYIGTAICIGWCIGNLITIGWFIIRVATALDIARSGQKEIQFITEEKSILDLRKEALEALDHNVPSAAIEIMKELSRRAKEKLSQPEDKPVARDCCDAIKNTGHYKSARFKEVWGIAAELLLELDKDARSKGNYNFSHSVTLPYLRNLFYDTSGSGFRISSPALPKLEEHFQDVFRQDIQNKQINFQRKKKTDEVVIDGLDATLHLLLIRRESRDTKHYLPIQEKIIEEIREVVENPELKRYYGIHHLFALILRLLIDRTYMTGEDESMLRTASEVAKLFAPRNPVELLDKSHDQIFTLDRNFIIKDTRRINELDDKLRRILSEEG